MEITELSSLDPFCSGHLVVDDQRNIVFCNQYILDIIGVDRSQIIGTSVSTYITAASNIFLDSYIYPILLMNSEVQECQITLLSQNGDRVPVVVNIKLHSDGRAYCSLFICVARDKLYNELLEARSQLEEKAKELYQLAVTDSLTGLLNRRELQKLAKISISQAARDGTNFAILTFDIDDFKQVNDTYGHPVGDLIIQHIAKLLTEDRREHDLVARVGGEEFVILLPGINEASAFSFAEKLRKKVESQPKDNLKVTVSIGIAISGANSDNHFEKLLAQSDQALYESKKHGKNRTTLACKT
jgi:diguanylate cyclase (GGDEF)-like protein/PAS domain S-box-containing protein